MANLRVDKITSTETFETTGSTQFDGSNDDLSVGSAGDFNYLHNGAASFTAEFWVYPQLVNSRQAIFSTGGNSSSTGFAVRIMASGDYGSSNGYLVGAQTSKGSDGNYLYWDSESTRLDADTWYHIATVYDHTHNTLKIYVDGKLTNGGHSRTYGTFGSHSTSNSSYALNVGQEPYGNTMHLKGHLSNLRILNGVKLYTSNFKPPMRELEVIPGTTLLTCQSKTSVTLDASGSHTVTSNGAPPASELTPGILTPIVKSGAGSAITGSVEFSGAPAATVGTDYLNVSSTDFAFGTSDFSVEMWFNSGDVSSAGQRGLIQLSDTVGGLKTNYTSGFVISTGVNNAGSGSNNNVNCHILGDELGSNTAPLRNHTWHHVTLTRQSGTARLFLNGILLGSSSAAESISAEHLVIGGWYSTSYLHKGFISNLRIVRGTALYTDDFIPPTRELKRVPGTVLLCCQDPDNPLTEATGKTIAGYGNLQRFNGTTELVTNGSFDSDTSSWTAANNATLSSVSGGISGNCLNVDSDGSSNGYARQNITTVVGQWYALSFYHKHVDGSAGYYNIGTSNGGDQIRYVVLGTQTDSWVQYYDVFQAQTTETRIQFYSRPNGNVRYDNISLVTSAAPGRSGASNFTPQVGDDRKVTFEGVTKIDTDAYFYLPTGDTVSRETTGTYNAGTRGIFGGGFSTPTNHHDTIQYINITSLGNAVDAGNLTASRYGNAALASDTRAVWAGGVNPSPGIFNTIDAVEIMSTGHAFDFGDLYDTVYYPGGVSNKTRGIYAGGYNPSNAPSGFAGSMGYITISSKGDSQDFGDLITAKNSYSTFGSPTRGCFAGGATPGKINTIEYVTFATTGNASDFGDLTAGRNYAGGCGSAIRGLVGGGQTPTTVNTIDYVNISAMGNAADFGDLTSARAEIGSCSSATRGIFAGAWSPIKVNVIDFVSLQTTGNAQTFGELVNVGVMQECGTSNGHGGLG